MAKVNFVYVSNPTRATITVGETVVPPEKVVQVAIDTEAEPEAFTELVGRGCAIAPASFGNDEGPVAEGTALITTPVELAQNGGRLLEENVRIVTSVGTDEHAEVGE